MVTGYLHPHAHPHHPGPAVTLGSTFSEVLSLSESCRFWVKMMLKTACDRLLVSFMLVAATVLPGKQDRGGGRRRGREGERDVKERSEDRQPNDDKVLTDIRIPQTLSHPELHTEPYASRRSGYMHLKLMHAMCRHCLVNACSTGGFSQHPIHLLAYISLC